MNKRNLFFISFFSLLLSLEVILRILGLHSPVIYVQDQDYEYIYAPNQKVNRFGNNIITNEFGMRSFPLDSNEIRILKIGDSVINGGTLTDHDNLASTILEKRLQPDFEKNIRVLNISAGSWGPDNAAAFIKKHGHFNAQKIILIFSSHDLYDLMAFHPVVGINPNYPDKKPFLAIHELWRRYLMPKMISKTVSSYSKIDANQININSNTINPGWMLLKEYSEMNNIELIAIIHPTKKELDSGYYNLTGKKLINLLDSIGIDYIPTLDLIKSSMYRDNIHINNYGQKFYAELLYPIIAKDIAESNE
jgi:hypothetical protein